MKDRRTMREFLAHKLLALSAVLAVAAVWFALSGGVSELILPSPAAVWRKFRLILELGYKGHSLWDHLADSLRRLFIAYGLAAATAVPLGLAAGCLTALRSALDPLVSFHRPLPPLAYYTVLVLWMGIDDNSKIALLYLSGFAPIYISCVAGVARLRPDYVNGAKTLGAGPWRIFTHVIFPAALPDIFIGLRNSLGASYSTLVAAEMVAAVSGLGWMVLDASRYLQSDVIFVGIIVMGLTGIILDEALKYAEGKIVFWKGRA